MGGGDLHRVGARRQLGGGGVDGQPGGLGAEQVAVQKLMRSILPGPGAARQTRGSAGAPEVSQASVMRSAMPISAFFM